tara:strand:+ start:33985 stop:34695 length:711 start_codon:yes stop_codon:yes gene_type:complete
MDKHFFDTVRPVFGKLKQHQVDGMDRIGEYAKLRGTSAVHLAYILATVFHETGKWMQPIREGALRYGPDYTDAQSIRAVTSIYNKGIIRTNYALPTGPYKQSYYGRGLVQITWYDNYLKFENRLDIPLTAKPDLALDWNYANPILFDGMALGLFTGKSLDMLNPAEPDFVAARAIVNGDVRKNGKKISDTAKVFLKALDNYETAPVQPVVEPVQDTEDETDETHGWRCIVPSWWPF